jgi:hypothetical protein
MKLCGSFETQANCQTAAVSDPAERWRSIMNGAPSLAKVHAFTVGFMSNHERTGNVGMGFRPVAHLHVFVFKPYGVTLAAEGATVARDMSNGKSLHHVSSITCIVGHEQP